MLPSGIGCFHLDSNTGTQVNMLLSNGQNANVGILTFSLDAHEYVFSRKGELAAEWYAANPRSNASSSYHNTFPAAVIKACLHVMALFALLRGLHLPSESINAMAMAKEALYVAGPGHVGQDTEDPNDLVIDFGQRGT